MAMFFFFSRGHVIVTSRPFMLNTDRLQSSILLALKPAGNGLTVVGDDAQSIYAFRAATVRNILDFPGQFARGQHHHARPQLPLHAADPRSRQRGHRSRDRRFRPRTYGLTGPRVQAPPRRRPRRTNQASYIVEYVLENRETGIAFETAGHPLPSLHHSGPLEVELTRRNIPFVKFGGLKFLDASHVEDVLGLLRFVENPRDRVAGVPGFAPTPRDRAPLGAAGARSHSGRRRPCCGPCRCPTTASGRRLERLRRDGHQDLRKNPQLACRPRPRAPVVRAAPRPHPRGLQHPARRPRPAGTNRSRYPSRERFLTELTLDPPDATSDQAGVPLLDEDYLILSPSIRPRAKNGNPSSCSTWSMAACR